MKAIVAKMTSVSLLLAISGFLYLFALSELPRYILWPGMLAGLIALAAAVAFVEKAFKRK
jgi:hypothetical protein